MPTKAQRLKQYPVKEGWIHMSVQLVNAKARSEKEIMRIVSWGKPELYEWGPVEQYGARVEVVMKEKTLTQLEEAKKA